MSRDPVEYEGSEWNLYEYVYSNPLRYVDAFGNRTCTATGRIITRPWTKYSAAGGGFGIGISTNPSIFNFKPCTSLLCTRLRIVDVQYSCTERYGFCWLKKRSYFIWETQTQTDDFTTEIKNNFVFIVGLDGPLPSRVPLPVGPVLSYYRILGTDQGKADNKCRTAGANRPSPPYTPPRTIP